MPSEQDASGDVPRYSVTVEGGFCATHRLRLPDGSVEPVHGHDWRVVATFASTELDGASMVVDFHRAQEVLRGVLAPLHLSDLNTAPLLAGRNPTAEIVARQIYASLTAAGLPVWSVGVTEAPGCVARFGRMGA
jgi:6-pyruvoyltetrahydropterin/6-carboxytetrahydropterin synthase